MAQQKKLAPVVAVLNMKGGVGKTTISAHVMRVLYHHHRIKTLLIDLDPQFNLTQALLPRSTYERIRGDNGTIYAVMEPPSSLGLHDIATTTKPPPKPVDIVHRLRRISGGQITLDLLPGDFRLVKYSMIDNRSKLNAAKDRFLRFVSSARREYGLVCVDCNPSCSFITSCALHVCTHLLVPVRPDRYSVMGLEILSDLVESIPTVHPKPTFVVLLNAIPRTGYHDTSVEDELRVHSKFGSETLASKLPHSKLLQASAGYTGFATDKPVPWKDLLKKEISAVVDEIVAKIGIV